MDIIPTSYRPWEAYCMTRLWSVRSLAGISYPPLAACAMALGCDGDNTKQITSKKDITMGGYHRDYNTISVYDSNDIHLSRYQDYYLYSINHYNSLARTTSNSWHAFFNVRSLTNLYILSTVNSELRAPFTFSWLSPQHSLGPLLVWVNKSWSKYYETTTYLKHVNFQYG